MSYINRTTEEINWVAGILEGEGCFSTNGNGSIIITLTMTDKDVVYKAASILGGNGSVIEINKDNLKDSGFKRVLKLYYRYSVYGPNAKEWMEVLYPLMGERRRKRILQLLEIYKKIILKPQHLSAMKNRQIKKLVKES